MTLVSIHPGDNDSTAAVGGTWIGALLGYDIFDKNRIKELEFYDMLKEVSKKLSSL
jgi:ADP-ribosylglycohydrolase